MKSGLVETGSAIELCEIKLGVRNKDRQAKDRLTLHLKFKEGQPEVVQVKKDDSRILCIDLMCLNR